jgi:tetratricopeptide (TPR) repeat protein
MLWCSALSSGSANQKPRSAVEEYLTAGNQAQQAGNLVEAEKLYLAAIEQAKQSNDPGLATALNNLAQLYSRMGQVNKAIERMKEALTVAETTYGPGDYRVAMDVSNLAMIYEMGHQDSEAEKCFKRGLEILENLPEPQRSGRFIILNNLSSLYLRQKRYPEIEALLKPAIEELENSPQPKGNELANLRHRLSIVYEREGKQNESEELESRMPEDFQPSQNPHVDPVYLTMQQAANYQRSGQLEAAEAGYRDVIAAWEKAKADKIRRPYYPGLLPAALEGLGRVYVAEKRNAEAEDVFKRAIELCEQYASPNKQGKAIVRSIPWLHLLNLYRTQGRLSEMEPILERWLAVQETILGTEDSAVGRTLVEFARVYREEGKSRGAQPLYQRALEIQEKNEGTSPGLAATLEEYANLLHDLNEEDEASAIRSRANQIRDRIATENREP